MSKSSAFKNKRVLVTGHTGFKGAWLCLALESLGARVAGFSDAIPTQPSFFEVAQAASHITDCRGDIRSYARVLSIIKEFKPEIIFHLAAQSLVRSSYDFPKETFDINVGGTVNILEAVRHAPFVQAMVIVTSDKCYKEKKGSQKNTLSFNEGDPLGGSDPYSASKSCTEIVFHSYADSFFKTQGPCIASARAGNVIGGGDWAQDRLVPDCIRSWSKGEKVIIRSPHVHRPWQSIFDVISGYLLLGEKVLEQNKDVRGESYNFGPSQSENHTVADVVSQLSLLWPTSEWQIQDNLTHKIEGSSFQLNSSKAKLALNWCPRMNLETTLKTTSDWYKRFYAGSKDMGSLSRTQLDAFLI